MAFVTAELNGAEQFTPALDVKGFDATFGVQRYVLVCVSGSFVGTLDVQISLDDGATWLDSADRITEPTVNNAVVVVDYKIRVGFKTGNYSSGSAVIVLAQ